jgi:CarD family transcriptional regulator
MLFKVGDKAVVPALGVGVIKEIERLNLGATVLEVYVIKILDNGLTYKVPLDRVEQNGIREVMTIDVIDAVYVVLGDREKPADKQTWNRRYREYMNKIKTGIPLEVAAVLRDLAILRSEKTLSFGERKMYDQAHGLIVQEIAVARDVDEAVVKAEIEKIFDEADERANPGRKRAQAVKRPLDEEEEEEPSSQDDDDDDL